LQLALNGLGRLLNGLFDLSRLDSGTVDVARRPVEVAGLLAELNNAFAGPAGAKGLGFKVRAPRGLWVDTDPLVLARVLSNLAANAVRYTDKGRILVGCRPRGNLLEFQVFDTGIGIADDERARIFGEFYQVPDVAREREHGLGLGLAIVSRSVPLLGGEIRVRSTPGKGSVFSVTLPRAAAPAAAEPGAAHAASHFTGSVLVVDDDPVVRESMQRLLGEWGHQVRVAATLGEAINAAAEQADSLELVLTDYHLGHGVTGPEIVEAVERRLGRQVSAVIITGDTSAETVAEAARNGLRLLYKPVEPRVLAALMKSIQ